MTPTLGAEITRRMASLRYYQAVMIVTLVVYLYYLIYRLLYTINWEVPVSSFIFYYAEFHGCLSLFLYFFQMGIRSSEHRLPRRPAYGSMSTSPPIRKMSASSEKRC